MYVYKFIDGNYVVGHYDPQTNKFIPESDWTTADGAAQRIHYLNGGSSR